MKTDSNQVKKPHIDQEKALGTFAGVFTPSIMTILGIILFLRLGYVVGSAGLGRALIIIGLANVISILTSVSLSAIATNLKVKGGGDYYLISRTLGVEFGGAIGIVLFMAQAVSIAFYCVGFGEAIAGILPASGILNPQIIAAFAVAFLSVLAWLGTDYATKFQYVVMALLGLALVSFFMGGFSKWNLHLAAQNWTTPEGGPPFWTLFAIFFPAVTGFTQGVSMSGELKDAGKSLPLGTFLAVGLSIIIYFGVAILFAGSLTNDALTNDYNAIGHVARVDFLIHAGVIAATLSSAMASFLGAPRILQALSKDRIFPFLNYFAEGHGPAGNPRSAVLLSLIIALITIAFGNLNVIAPVVAMFFLISYGLLNYATYYEAESSSPSFRPRFRFFDHRLSLLGFVACLGAMLAIDMAAGLVAASILVAVYQYLKRTAGPARWADSSRSHHLQQIRENLLAADLEPEHPRNWRPQILAVSETSEKREPLLRFASWLQGGSGLTTALQIVEGEGLKTIRNRDKLQAELKNEIAALKLEAFPLVLAVPKIEGVLNTIVQGYGMGPLKANTLLINLLDTYEDNPTGVDVINIQTLQAVFHLNCNIVMLNAGDSAWKAIQEVSTPMPRIDVWWWDDATSHFMLLLAYLMTRDEKWHETRLRVLAACYEDACEDNNQALRKILDDIRIEAEHEIVVNPTAASILDYSSDAAMVFFPFHIKGDRITWPFETQFEALLEKLPVTAMVLAAEDIDLDAEPEDGRPQEIAEALDAIEESIKRSHETEKNAEKAARAAEEAAQRLHEMIDAAGPGVPKETMERIEKAAKDSDMAKERADKAAKKAAKAHAVAKQMAEQAESLGVTPKNDKESGG